MWYVGFLFNNLQIQDDANLNPVPRLTSCRLIEVKENPFRTDRNCSVKHLAVGLYIYL